MFADLILKSNAVFDATGREPFAGGVAIAGEKIVACGDEALLAQYVGPDTEVRDYGDRLIMPGFNDSHTHFTQGALVDDPDFCVTVGATASLDECLAKVRVFADAHPDNEWVLGNAVAQYDWPDPVMPTAAQIDAVIPDRPVVLVHVELHTFSANAMAMAKAGITAATPDPYGGEIARDAEGRPTGVFANTAGDFFTRPIFSPGADVLRSAYRKGFERYRQLGITTVCNLYPEGVTVGDSCGAAAGDAGDPYAIFKDFEAAGELPFRMPFYIALMGEGQVERIRSLQARYNTPGSLVTCNGFKILIDGVTSDESAWLLAPYASDPTTCGQPAMDLGQVRRDLMAACEAGFPVRIHTIGDRAVRWALDAFEQARDCERGCASDGVSDRVGDHVGEKSLRHVMEHLELTAPSDRARFAELGVVACVQPMHVLLDLEFSAKEKTVGEARVPDCWAFRSLVDAGATLAMGTDYPVVEIDPLHEVYAAVTRELLEGGPAGGWVPEERISLVDTLRAYTWGSAYCEGVEDSLGTLEAGKLADVIVLSRNLFAIEPAEYLTTAVDLTVFNGRIVHDAGGC